VAGAWYRQLRSVNAEHVVASDDKRRELAAMRRSR